MSKGEFRRLLLISRHSGTLLYVVRNNQNSRHLGFALGLLKKRDKRRLIQISLIQSAFSLFDVAGIFLIGIVTSIAVKTVQGDSPGDRTLIVLKFINLEELNPKIQVGLLATLSCLFFVAKSLMSWIFTKKVYLAVGNMAAEISTEFIALVTQSGLSKLNRRSTQSIIYSATKGTADILNSIITPLFALLPDVVFLLVTFAALLFVEITVTFFMLLFLSCCSFVMFRIMAGSAKRLGGEITTSSIKNSEIVEELVKAFRVLYVRNTFSNFINDFRKNRKSIAYLQAQARFLPLIPKYVIELILILGVFIFSTYLMFSGSPSSSAGVLTIFLVASARLVPAIMRIQQSALQIKSGLGISENTLSHIRELQREVSNSSTDINEAREPISRAMPKSVEVDLSNVSFSIKNSNFHLTNVEFQASSGDHLAITGRTGSGKSTLVDLLIGILEPSSGRITLNGIKPRDFVRFNTGFIGYVPQETFVLNRSIRDNLILSNSSEEMSDEDLYEVIKIVSLESILDEKLGLGTLLGQSGRILSGGEKQRLGIARALITNPGILILDEATSALDYETEENIMQKLTSMSERLLISVSHRDSTLKYANKILILDNGSVKIREN